MRRFWLVGMVCLAGCLLVLSRSTTRAEEASDREFFERKIRPLLKKQCLLCHGGTKTRNGLEVTSREALIRGGTHGPAILPGDPEKSLLIQSVRYEGSYPMPPRAKMSQAEIDTLTEWVRRGAPWSNNK